MKAADKKAIKAHILNLWENSLDRILDNFEEEVVDYDNEYADSEQMISEYLADELFLALEDTLITVTNFERTVTVDSKLLPVE